jgi:hypothetical protein
MHCRVLKQEIQTTNVMYVMEEFALWLKRDYIEKLVQKPNA